MILSKSIVSLAAAVCAAATILFAAAEGKLLAQASRPATDPASRPAAASSPAAGAFIHPGLYYAANDLEFMRKKLAARAEPWYSAWEKGKPGAREEGWTPHPEANWDATKGLHMGGDPLVAHKEALQWALTGNPANAAKAIEVLNAWSSTLQTIVIHEKPSEKLAIGCSVPDLVNAAELLCHARPEGKTSGWAEADIQRFKKMLGLVYEVIKDFQPVYNGNWDALMMNSMACMGVFLDDRAMFDRAVNHYLKGERPNGGLTNYIYPSGQCQESKRDQTHVQGGLGGFVALCEVAWKQGVDLYGAGNNRLLVGLEYTAKYNLGEDVPFEGKGVISEKGRGGFAPIWETAYQHYVYRKGLEMPYTRQIIFGKHRNRRGDLVPYRPEGQTQWGLSWGTFTMFKGEEDPQAVKKTTPSAGTPSVQKEDSK